ncbi:hypothetical protein Tco_0828519, partial [Tanacetum coccineum]
IIDITLILDKVLAEIGCFRPVSPISDLGFDDTASDASLMRAK